MDREARAVIDAAKTAGLAMRTIGSVAVWQRLPADVRARYEDLRPPPKDLDALAPKKSSGTIKQVFAAQGYAADDRLIAWHGDHRHRYFRLDGDGAPVLEVDVFLGRPPACHPFDPADFSATEGHALGATDLLLQKLQIVESGTKDLIDIAFMLLAHETANAERSDVLALPRIAQLLASDWGFYYTATQNLEKTEACVRDLLGGEHADTVVTRSTELREAIDGEPKGRLWRMRARVGTRKQWYEDVEELDR